MTVTVFVTPVGKGVILELLVRTLVMVTDSVAVREPLDDTDVVTLAVTVFDEDDEPVIVDVLYIVIDCAEVFVIVERDVLVFEGAALLLDETEVDCVFDCDTLPVVVGVVNELRDGWADFELVGVDVWHAEYVIVRLAVFVIDTPVVFVTVPLIEALFVFVTLLVIVPVVFADAVVVRDWRGEPVIVIVETCVPDTVAVPRTETVFLGLSVFVDADDDVLLEDTDAVCVPVRFTVPVITGLPDTVFVGAEVRDPEALAVGVRVGRVETVLDTEAVLVLDDVIEPVVVTLGLIVLVI